MFKINDKVKIKEEVWQKFCNDNNFPISLNVEQLVTRVHSNNQEMFYLLSFPLVWWREEDLEEIKM